MHAVLSFHLEISELDSSCDRHSQKERHGTRVHDDALKVRMKTLEALNVGSETLQLISKI
jgi:hypothetical protein